MADEETANPAPEDYIIETSESGVMTVTPLGMSFGSWDLMMEAIRLDMVQRAPNIWLRTDNDNFRKIDPTEA